jgi:molybdenum cofactor cytidylyltransferase
MASATAGTAVGVGAAGTRFRPTIVVVAAGSGSRFGGAMHKLDQPFGNLAGSARTVLGATLRRAVESQLPIVLVCTAARAPAAEGLLARRDVVIVGEAEAQRGMGHSIAAGVAERSGAPGWLVLPADMPLVRPSSLLAVAGALEQHAVAYAQHRGRRGHPVGFAAELYSELVRLTGDEGARRIVARYPSVAVELDDPGVLIDVDTPADLEAARVAAESVQATGDR